MSKVALIRCESYDTEAVYAALKKGIDLLGGITAFVDPTEKILLKPNLLRGKDPDGAVTTHPAVFNAMASLLEEAGCNQLTYGDSPGVGSPEKVSGDAGIAVVAKNHDIPLVEFNTGKTVYYPDGAVTKQFEIAQGVLESDAIVSLCKMKTHGLTRITGAVKNQLGCVYGFNKGASHARFPKAPEFAKMLVDLNLFLKPRLFVMDGIVAMEGNGPASGTPISMNCLLISDDPVALDATFARMVNLEPDFVPTITAGQEMGLGSYRDVAIVGDNLSDFINPDFDVERLPVKDETSISFLLGSLQHFKGLLVRKPVVIPEKCIGCGLCYKACPLAEKAITMIRKKGKTRPSYDYKKCIRCYCCQEMCPKQAIEVKTPLVGKLFVYKK